jgi:hypothetical protein
VRPKTAPGASPYDPESDSSALEGSERTDGLGSGLSGGLSVQQSECNNGHLFNPCPHPRAGAPSERWGGCLRPGVPGSGGQRSRCVFARGGGQGRKASGAGRGKCRWIPHRASRHARAAETGHRQS